MKKFLEIVISYLTPFTWRNFISLGVALVACALVLYLTSCHVQRECRSFTIVQVDRIDTIEYNSKFHKDTKTFNHSDYVRY